VTFALLVLLISAEPAPVTHDADRPVLLGGSAAVGAASAGAAACSWLDRDGGFGRACAITSGVFGGAALGAALAWLGTSLFHGPQRTVYEDLAVHLSPIFGMLVGAAVGGLVAVFASGSRGTPRGVLGVTGGALGFVGASVSFGFAWFD
jgi:hypothetical protein